MPKFDITAVEKFEVRTNYYGVEADTPEEAEELCREGAECYQDTEILEDNAEWLRTEEVELSENQDDDDEEE